MHLRPSSPRALRRASAELTARLVRGEAVDPSLVYFRCTPSFEAKTVADAVKAFGGGAPVESKDVTITGPDIAENGAVVPLGAATTLAGVKHMVLLVEKNPSALIAMFNVSDSVEANFSTRAKMGQSSDVYAVAIMNDGKALYAKKEVKVTLGGCGG